MHDERPSAETRAPFGALEIAGIVLGVVMGRVIPADGNRRLAMAVGAGIGIAIGIGVRRWWTTRHPSGVAVLRRIDALAYALSILCLLSVVGFIVESAVTHGRQLRDSAPALILVFLGIVLCAILWSLQTPSRDQVRWRGVVLSVCALFAGILGFAVMYETDQLLAWLGLVILSGGGLFRLVRDRSKGHRHYGPRADR